MNHKNFILMTLLFGFNLISAVRPSLKDVEKNWKSPQAVDDYCEKKNLKSKNLEVVVLLACLQVYATCNAQKEFDEIAEMLDKALGEAWHDFSK